MPQIPEVFTFDVSTNQIFLETSNNGDMLHVGGYRGSAALHLSSEDAATVSWLINQPDVILELKLRVKPI